MKYFLPLLLILFFLSVNFLACVQNVQAQVDCSDSSFWNSGIVPCGRNCNNTNTTADETKPCTLCHFIVGFNDLINYGFKILVFLALVCLVIAGVMYILSAGNEQMITTAKTFIKQVLYGFGFVLAAWLLIFIVMNYFGVKSDLGIEKTEGWTKFTCSTESVTGTGTGSPTSTTTITAEHCCVVGAGQCGHVQDTSQCTNGTYHEEACSEISECSSDASSCGNQNL